MKYNLKKVAFMKNKISFKFDGILKCFYTIRVYFLMLEKELSRSIAKTELRNF